MGFELATKTGEDITLREIVSQNLERNLNLFKFRSSHLTWENKYLRAWSESSKYTPLCSESRTKWRALSASVPILKASVTYCLMGDKAGRGTFHWASYITSMSLFSQNLTTHHITPFCLHPAPAIFILLNLKFNMGDIASLKRSFFQSVAKRFWNQLKERHFWGNWISQTQ